MRDSCSKCLQETRDRTITFRERVKLQVALGTFLKMSTDYNNRESPIFLAGACVEARTEPHGFSAAITIKVRSHE
jgi:hypothetical protein